MLGRMAIAAGTHFGPWSEEDLVGLPDETRGYELLEGTLLVNPPPGGPHQRASGKLFALLDAITTPDYTVVEGMGVRLPGNTMFIPDVLVARRDAVLAYTSGILDPPDVALVVEIVSPGSRIMDRVSKPAVYAGVGIISFWRVELKDGPAIFAYRLEQGRYLEAGSARPGERLVAAEPFAVSIDPADLRP
ncbi:MAG TPA: Uma2 family endonuclease [Actinomycetota bacterium]